MSKWEVIQVLRKSLFPKTSMELQELGITKPDTKLRALYSKPNSILDRIVKKGKKRRSCFAYIIKKGIKKSTLDSYEPYVFEMR